VGVNTTKHIETPRVVIVPRGALTKRRGKMSDKIPRIKRIEHEKNELIERAKEKINEIDLYYDGYCLKDDSTCRKVDELEGQLENIRLKIKGVCEVLDYEIGFKLTHGC
jgi:chromosome segregation ATPase